MDQSQKHGRAVQTYATGICKAMNMNSSCMLWRNIKKREDFPTWMQKNMDTQNVDAKINLGFLVSDNHLPTGRHNGSITEKWLRAEGTYIGTIAHTSAVMSTLPLKRSSIDMTVEVTKCTEAKCSHVTL